MDKIVSIVSDGKSIGTKALNSDGKEIPGISSIKIGEINPDSQIVTAVITLRCALGDHSVRPVDMGDWTGPFNPTE